MTRKSKLFHLVGLALIITSSAIIYFTRGGGPEEANNISKKVILPDNTVFSNFSQFEGIPEVGDVSEYRVTNPVGTAILIPQIHRYPGSNATDKINDTAEIVQKQILTIISNLSEMGVEMAMMEGDPFGKISNGKIEKITKKFELRNKFFSQSEKIRKLVEEQNGPESAELFKESISGYIDSIDREIILQGAPLAFKVEGGNLDLYGSEIIETQNKCAEIVRKLTYLQDAEKKKSANVDSSNQNSKLKNLLSAYKSMSEANVKNSQTVELRNLISNSSGELKQAVDELKNIYQDISGNDGNSLLANAGTSVPARSQNPYLDLSLSQIKKEINNTEKEISKYVVEKRNSETASNFAQVLKSGNFKSGILEYGAAHEEGLVKELNKNNISVVVITPKEVINQKA